MKSYQHGAQFTLLSGISLALSYITHKSKLAWKSLRVLYRYIKFVVCVSASICSMRVWLWNTNERRDGMRNNFPARSGVASVQRSLARGIMINTHTQTRIGTHGSRHVLLIPLRNQPQTGSVMQRGSVGSRCRGTSKAPDGTLICSGRFSI